MNHRQPIDVLKVSLPCGGELWFSFVQDPVSVEVDRVNVTCLPKVFCPGTYRDGQGCPWVDRLRKFYDRFDGLNNSFAKADVPSGVSESGVKDLDGSVGKICEHNNWMTVICRDKILYDRNVRMIETDEPCDLFDKCNYVKARNGGIIAFFSKLFGRRG